MIKYMILYRYGILLTLCKAVNMVTAYGRQDIAGINCLRRNWDIYFYIFTGLFSLMGGKGCMPRGSKLPCLRFQPNTGFSLAVRLI